MRLGILEEQPVRVNGVVTVPWEHASLPQFAKPIFKFARSVTSQRAPLQKFLCSKPCAQKVTKTCRETAQRVRGRNCESSDCSLDVTRPHTSISPMFSFFRAVCCICSFCVCLCLLRLPASLSVCPSGCVCALEIVGMHVLVFVSMWMGLCTCYDVGVRLPPDQRRCRGGVGACCKCTCIADCMSFGVCRERVQNPDHGVSSDQGERRAGNSSQVAILAPCACRAS